MRDPHVVYLTYRMTPVSGSVVFDNPPAIEKETDEFIMKLMDDVVTFEMKTHFASMAGAQGAVSNFLRSWEIDSRLKDQGIAFVYNDAKLIDRNPYLPGESQVFCPEPAVALGLRGSASVCVMRKTYLEPPQDFHATPASTRRSSAMPAA